jgi:phage-related baseplate assembly protein
MTRFNLAEINFVDLDTAELENIAVAKFEELQGVTLKEADPRRKFIQANVFIAMMLANNIDYTGKQNLLTYANDDYLDHIGTKKDVERLGPVASKTIMRFNVNNPETFIIPSGTRFTINDLIFATETDQTVDIGVLSVDVVVVCMEEGTIGNGFLPGQITELVDPLPWVASAANITTTAGGSDWETNDAYADRIRNANESYSTAGPELAYTYFAKSANQDIIDVQVSSPNPCEVKIIVLMKNGTLPTQEVKDQVLAKCSDRSVRPLTDLVSVADPILSEYNLTVSYYLPESSRDSQVSVQENVTAAVQDYLLWQKSKLGRGIDPSELYARMQAAGAKRIAVEPNGYVALTREQVAKNMLINVTFGGFIND